MLLKNEFESIRGLANKLPEHAARIAAAIALFDNIHTGNLTKKHFEIGVRVAEHYAKEALRFISSSVVDHRITLAEKLLSWLHGSWKLEFVSLPYIYQNLYGITGKNKALEIVTILENHGWLVKAKESKIINNQMRREVWRIIRAKRDILKSIITLENFRETLDTEDPLSPCT